jgi:hypothetical protein
VQFVWSRGADALCVRHPKRRALPPFISPPCAPKRWPPVPKLAAFSLPKADRICSAHPASRQRERFVAAARSVGADKTEDGFDRAFRAVVVAKPPPAKPQKR